MTMSLRTATDNRSILARAIESDCTYFEMGAEIIRLRGATMSWMPGLAASPAAAVIYRVDLDAVTIDRGWIDEAEAAMANVGAAMNRIYLDVGQEAADAALRDSGYVAREELVFVDGVADPSIDLKLRPVVSEADWADKLRFHEMTDETPDGHANRAADWVELERCKCRAGMEGFLAEFDGEVVGAVGAIWCDGFVRTKNLVIHPGRRRRGFARAILGRIAAMGRQRGISDQCVLAVKGDDGELLYRALGMAMVGSQVEWSKPLTCRA